MDTIDVPNTKPAARWCDIWVCRVNHETEFQYTEEEKHMQTDRQVLQNKIIEQGGHMEHLLPHRMLGKTNMSVSILGLGGGGLFFDANNRDMADEVVNRAIDLGINYLDTAPSYGAGEDLYGNVMRRRRGDVFLATKIDARDRDGAWKSIETSLRRLQTDVIDLIQVHDIEKNEDVDKVLAMDGAIRAMEEAHDQGVVRWMGVTGHRNPDKLLYAIEQYDFDTVLMPVNITDKAYLSFIDKVMPVAQSKNMVIVGMKVYCSHGIFADLDVLPGEALRYSLSNPVSTCVVGVDNVNQLLSNIDVARQFTPMNEDEMTALEARTKDKAAMCNTKFKEYA
jgi:aryl-alcohol dehydrogenase-like predicted oxidoreductase